MPGGDRGAQTLCFLCDRRPKTWCWSLSRLFIFRFPCGVTVGSNFTFSPGDHCSFAVFPGSSFWHFPHPPCDSRSKCLHSCLFCPITAALAPLWGWGVSRAGAAAVCSQRMKEHRLRLPSFFWADKAAENKRRVESSG